MGGARNFKFGVRIELASPVLRDKILPKGMWSGSRGRNEILNFKTPYLNFGTGEARNFKFGTP